MSATPDARSDAGRLTEIKIRLDELDEQRRELIRELAGLLGPGARPVNIRRRNRRRHNRGYSLFHKDIGNGHGDHQRQAQLPCPGE
jgi:hypothetical protein